ncbi:DUF5776 domain-containing protein [Apilactobacillus ozensis]|uniref:DUF5776 domain-containing protein n=1 Tax=Apilactobacillus ozensis TaxID=866801 RepID=UPI00200B9E2A|nr:DUF5776 domain-containing protein [Apilactobacillus ozensis]MCK8607126.1 DUF5776 domain-containing protein [Apilactobacillus ozensis]
MLIIFTIKQPILELWTLGINQAKDAGIANVDHAHQPGQEVDSRKADATKAIDDEVQKVNIQIDKDKNLDNDAKNKQKADATDAAKNAKQMINNAKDAQDILDLIPTGIANIDKSYVPGKPHTDYVPLPTIPVHNAIKDFNNGIMRTDTTIIYDNNYKNVRSGFEDGINGLTAAEKSSKVYMAGYKMAVEGLSGMKAAQSIDKINVSDLSGKSAEFNAGFNGYLAGLKAAMKDLKKSYDNDSPVYKFTYDKGYAAGKKQAIKIAHDDGFKQGKDSKEMPKLKGYSKEYIEAFRQGFIKRQNLESKNKTFNVLADSGIYVHSSGVFTKNNRVRKMKKGDKFTVKNVVLVDGVTRYYINENEYVTSDKNLVG